MLEGIVYTDKEKCEACSACLRKCQTKSVKIAERKAEIITESCLNCGLCIGACSKGAKKYTSCVEAVQSLFEENKKTAVILAPSYVIVAVKKYNCTPGQFCSALKRLGFALVYEASFGADIVTKVYLDYLEKMIKTKGKKTLILLPALAPRS